MAWNNSTIVLFHGCDDRSANAILKQGVNITLGRPRADFGRGFYTTTWLHQARNWAMMKCLRVAKQPGQPKPSPVVLGFDVQRAQLGAELSLCFVTEGSSPDYWDLVRHCRGGGHSGGKGPTYAVVHGPVSLWRQLLVVKDADQVSFHDQAVATRLLGTPRLVP